MRKELLKASVKFEKVDAETGKKRYTTHRICGRTAEELAERTERLIRRQTSLYGWSVR